MPNYTHSLIIIAPLDRVEAINAISTTAGHTNRELSISLSDNGETETHRGCHAWATEATALAWATAPAIPPYDEAETAALRAEVIVEVQTETEAIDHWQDVLTAHGLTEDFGTADDEINPIEAP